MPHSMSSLSTRHQSDKINPYHIRVDFIFVHIHICCTLEYASLHDTEGIEWMSMRLISAIPYLNKYPEFPISCNNIYLSSLYLVVAILDNISLTFKVSDCNILSYISDATTWLCHSYKYMVFISYVQLRRKKRAFLPFLKLYYLTNSTTFANTSGLVMARLERTLRLSPTRLR